MRKLTEESLEFAKNHIQKFYDSDFFPKAFEYEALWENWSDVKQHILNREIDSISFGLPRTFCAPKPKGSFRVVHQLDPIASVVYTAIAYIIGEAVELARLPIEDKKACSYRISIDMSKGTFFKDGAGYKDYQEKAHSLSNDYSYVLLTDITDFYNQIYVHRLRNAVYLLGEEFREISVCLENFLLDINGSSSQGIPVGPAASIIMAEATLIDVDQFITSKGFEHVRYVDDIKIFGKNEKELMELLDSLTLYLYENHRLSLSGQKTFIQTVDHFKEKILDSPDEQERANIHKILQSVTSPRDAYESYVEEPPSETQVRPSVLDEMMSNLLQMNILDLGIARHILRRSRRYRIRAVSSSVIKNIDFLSPVISDVVLYLDKITNERFISENIAKFENFIDESVTANLPFVNFWMSEYFHKNPKYFSSKKITAYVKNSSNYESAANLAIDTSDLAWFRQNKYRIGNLNPWQKRSLFKSALGFSNDECSAWLRALERRSGEDILDKSVIRWVISRNA
ncbi:RNA-directed DNA polymerase [Teredinibacter turnerae]|uniref:RNA-directed DNA polymerase n=1 Tax=Teredinibacter turnerae TaxID=2426 RepID=UPI0003635511|nr:RNA-directed DNA polymerase [Teredinibacter turnerae]